MAFCASKPSPSFSTLLSSPDVTDEQCICLAELRGGDELLFQFYGREGWPLAEQLGTVSVGQTVLAERKLAKLSRIQKPGKKVWFWDTMTNCTARQQPICNATVIAV